MPHHGAFSWHETSENLEKCGEIVLVFLNSCLCLEIMMKGYISTSIKYLHIFPGFLPYAALKAGKGQGVHINVVENLSLSGLQ